MASGFYSYDQAGLNNLRDVLFVGNPIYEEFTRDQARIEVIKRLPQVAKIDGDMVSILYFLYLLLY